MKYEIGSKFDSLECLGCSMVENCAAGRFMTAAREVADDSTTLMDHYSDWVTEEFPHIEPQGLQDIIDELNGELQSAKQRFSQAVTAAEVFVQKVVAQPELDTGRVIPDDFPYQPHVEEFREAPIDTSRLNIDPAALKGFRGSAIHYANVGVCNAVEVYKLS